MSEWKPTSALYTIMMSIILLIILATFHIPCAIPSIIIPGAFTYLLVPPCPIHMRGINKALDKQPSGSHPTTNGVTAD